MDELIESAHRLFGIQLTASQRAAFHIYESELIDWNTRANLTAIHDVHQIRVKHFLDSLSCTLAMRGTPANQVIDIGTGAGFPGIPLKIVEPSRNLTLVESIGKKAEFCRYICAQLNFTGAEVIQERAEIVASRPDNREKYDWAVARAVAILPVLVEYLLPLVHLGGYALAMKGETGPTEAHSAEKAIHILGGQIEQLIPVTLPGVEIERYLVVIKKIATTPENFPRRVGIPAKRPLGTH
ncbi:MAG: 16S rRNA (guanine(527)-N(7))-methyltransferase RsmG [Anaerolineales bacterium]|jgi:16S rRNA (guanine527-N7)-methyltransferase